jgi:hypothetical protein
MFGALPAILLRSPQLRQNGGLSVIFSIGEREISRVVWDDLHVICGKKFASTASSFVTKVRSGVFTHVYAVTVQLHSSMRNWLFCLSGLILCEQSPWCHRKLWACSWFALHMSRLFFLVSVSLDSSFTAHAFFHERLSNHCQGLCRTFPEICRKFDAVPLSGPSWNRMRPYTRLQIREREEISTSNHLRDIFLLTRMKC